MQLHLTAPLCSDLNPRWRYARWGGSRLDRDRSRTAFPKRPMATPIKALEGGADHCPSTGKMPGDTGGRFAFGISRGRMQMHVTSCHLAQKCPTIHVIWHQNVRRIMSFRLK